jgi:hypothetical protein
MLSTKIILVSVVHEDGEVAELSFVHRKFRTVGRWASAVRGSWREHPFVKIICEYIYFIAAPSTFVMKAADNAYSCTVYVVEFLKFKGNF